MTRHHLYLVCAALAGTLGLASCKPSEPPPPPKVEAPKVVTPAAPAMDAQLQRLAAEVYVYAFPLVLTDVTRQVEVAEGDLNDFRRQSKLPDATTTDVIRPNADFLYVQAWLDLSKDPVILSVPNTRGRYYLIALLDAYTNVAASLGKRTSGTDKRDFAIIGPNWKGNLPEGTTEIRSPTELAWLFGRIAVHDKGDLGTAVKVQDQFKLKSAAAPPKRRGKKTEEPPPAPAANVDTKTPPRDQVAAMDPATFYTRLAMLLPGNPPPKEDAPMLDKIAKLGVIAGQPFDLGKLEPIAARSVEAGAKTGLDAIITASRGSATGDIRHGWRVDLALGRWGTEYGRRALAAWNGLGVNAPEDAIFLATQLDVEGRRLDGANRYVLHFDAKQLPPTEAFWSLSLYNDKQHFFANPDGRYNVGSDEKLKRNADGSLDVYIQNASPGEAREANWLPSPAKGPFTLMLRVYWPKSEVIEGRWTPPGVRVAKQS